MAQYEAKFIELFRFTLLIVVDEAHMTRRFERGLRSSIRTRLSIFKLRNYAEIVDRALMVKKDCSEYLKE